MENSPLSPMLYLVATPIGNMEDITLRALRVLKCADAVYCEDTRHSGALLAKLGIKKPLISCHEHNESLRAGEVLCRVKAGEAIAYISDAGMPGISDPGARLVTAFIREGAPYTVIPGASAMPTALVLSGMDAASACFVGFLPRTGRERRERIANAALHRGALIFYESPLRVASTAEELMGALGNRECALCRELTKLHEEVVHGTLASIAGRYAETPPKGECVLVVEGAREEAPETRAQDAENAARELLAGGMSAKDAARELARRTGISKNDAYNIVKEMQ